MKRTTLLLTLFLSLSLFAQDTYFDSFEELTPFYDFPITYTVYNAGINTKYADEGASFYKNKFIIISSRKTGAFVKKDKLTNQPYSQIFCFDIDGKGNLKRPLLFASSLNSKYHEGAVAFTPDEKTVYFTRSDEQNNYKLYSATLSESRIGKWENIKPLNIVDQHQNIKDIFINNEGTLLYFSSDAEGGYGGFDLYTADIKSNHTLGEPLNLGNKINTSGDERSPYVTPNKKHLFFSSTAHGAYGGLDIFKSRIVHHDFKKPINLGQDINSSYDDYGYILANNKIGYFTSNRAGGIGNTDIYKFTIKTAKQELKGYVLDKTSQIVLPNTKLTLLDAEDNIIKVTSSDKNGFYKFTNIEALESYSIISDKDGFFSSNIPFRAHQRYDYTYKRDVELIQTTPEIVEVNNLLVIELEDIYFDFDKTIIKNESTLSLNKVAKILKDYPEYILNINAHTDNQGSAAYNLNLSKNRAKSALNYLVKHGIPKSRLKAIGHGESKLLIDCNPCSEHDHEINRRIEFILKTE